MFRVDQHLHTARHSPDSIMDEFEMLAHAHALGLDALVVTDHDYLWPAEEIAELQARANGLVVLPGVEVSALEGHFLVYGLPHLEDVEEGIPLCDLLDVVRRCGAAIVAAHPFRWEQDFEEIIRDHGRAFQALELVSNNVSPQTRARTRSLSGLHDLALTGSSDAHALETLGCYFTEYPQPIRSVADLVSALHQRAFRPRHRCGAALASGPVD